jgi:hypothetical protein
MYSTPGTIQSNLRSLIYSTLSKWYYQLRQKIALNEAVEPGNPSRNADVHEPAIYADVKLAVDAMPNIHPDKAHHCSAITLGRSYQVCFVLIHFSI